MGAGGVKRADRDRIKIWFRFVPREGWLPYESEGMWATRVGTDSARIDNVPFLQDGIAQGDVVRFAPHEDGLFWAVERVAASDNCTVRVLPDPDGPLGRSAQAVHDQFRPFGLGGEVYSEDLPLVAMNVPSDSDLPGIKALLIGGEEAGWWSFEASCVTDAWNAA